MLLQNLKAKLRDFDGRASSNIKCPSKKGKGEEQKESHGNRVILDLTTNQRTYGGTMGRRQLTRQKHCKGSHFTWGERLRLQCF